MAYYAGKMSYSTVKRPLTPAEHRAEEAPSVDYTGGVRVCPTGTAQVKRNQLSVQLMVYSA